MHHSFIDLLQVEFRHLRTFFLGSATAVIIISKIKEALAEAMLNFTDIISISMDGPNVNKTILREIDDEMSKERGTRLIKTGSCNLHVLNNVFKKGLKIYGHNVENLAIQAYCWFDGYPSRKEDFKKYVAKEFPTIKTTVFLKHSPSRWLTLNPALIRLSQLFNALKKYFLEYLLTKEKFKITKYYENITSLLKDQFIEVELVIIIESSNLLNVYNATLQQKKPLIHQLYTELISLIKEIANKICLEPNKDLEYLFDLWNLKSASLIITSDAVNNAMSSIIDEDDRIAILNQYIKHYLELGRKLIQTNNCNFKMLKSFEVLDPRKIKNDGIAQGLQYLLNFFPQKGQNEEFRQNVMAEFQQLQSQNIVFSDADINNIDQFWYTFFEENKNYPNLKHVFLNLICVSHGQADVERFFSTSGQFLTEDKAQITERTFNSVLNCMDGLKEYKNKIHLFPFSDDLILRARNARKSYGLYLEQNKLEKAAENEQQDLINKKLSDKKKFLDRLAQEQDNLDRTKGQINQQDERIEKNIRKIKQLTKEANLAYKVGMSTNNPQKMFEAVGLWESIELEKKKQKECRLELSGLKREQTTLTTNILSKRAKLE